MIFKKLYYKLFKGENKNEYKAEYKIDLYKNKYEKIINQINKAVLEKKELNFLHSGTSGDLIYSFALVKKLSNTHKCNFFVGVNKKFTYEYYKHTGEGFLIKTIEELKSDFVFSMFSSFFDPKKKGKN